MTRIHDAAARGFERGAEDDDRGRPSYPVEVFRTMEEAGVLTDGAAPVDVGAGTGTFVERYRTELFWCRRR